MQIRYSDIKSTIRKIGQVVPDALFPRRCVLCRSITPAQPETGLCELCRWDDYRNPNPENEEEKGRCSFLYEDQLQRAIYRMKYSGLKGCGVYFARWMYKEGKEWAADRHFDRMTAVPLAKNRLKNRGYNQAEVIAKELSRLCRVPYVELLERRRDTKPQSGLGEEQRSYNLKEAFMVREMVEAPRRICVVDDIYTTGSTVRECIRTLKAKWPEAEVWYWVLARRDMK